MEEGVVHVKRSKRDNLNIILSRHVVANVVDASTHKSDTRVRELGAFSRFERAAKVARALDFSECVCVGGVHETRRAYI